MGLLVTKPAFPMNFSNPVKFPVIGISFSEKGERYTKNNFSVSSRPLAAIFSFTAPESCYKMFISNLSTEQRKRSHSPSSADTLENKQF